MSSIETGLRAFILSVGLIGLILGVVVILKISFVLGKILTAYLCWIGEYTRRNVNAEWRTYPFNKRRAFGYALLGVTLAVVSASIGTALILALGVTSLVVLVINLEVFVQRYAKITVNRALKEKRRRLASFHMTVSTLLTIMVPLVALYTASQWQVNSLLPALAISWVYVFAHVVWGAYTREATEVLTFFIDIIVDWFKDLTAPIVRLLRAISKIPGRVFRRLILAPLRRIKNLLGRLFRRVFPRRKKGGESVVQTGTTTTTSDN